MKGCNSKYPDYFGDIIPDSAVRYTGIECKSLGICEGDMLDEVLKAIVAKLCDGVEISVNIPQPDCSFIVPHNNTISSAFISTFDAICELKSEFVTVYEYIDEKTALNLNGKCITLPTNITINKTFQAIIDYVCTINTGGSNTTNVIDVLNILFNAVENCGSSFIQKSGSGANQKMTFSGFVPPKTLLCGVYNLSDFDGNGLGKTNTDVCGWALADGRNGTQDMRGMTAVGSTSYGSGTLHTSVDPVVNSDVDYGLTVGQVKGAVKAKQLGTQVGSHTHAFQIYTVNIDTEGACTIAVPGIGVECGNNVISQITTATNQQQLSVQPMDRRQPSRGVVWIQKL